MWENTRKYAIIKREAIMITVTNGKEFIKISSKYLQKKRKWLSNKTRI